MVINANNYSLTEYGVGNKRYLFQTKITPSPPQKKINKKVKA